MEEEEEEVDEEGEVNTQVENNASLLCLYSRPGRPQQGGSPPPLLGHKVVIDDTVTSRAWGRERRGGWSLEVGLPYGDRKRVVRPSSVVQTGVASH